MGPVFKNHIVICGWNYRGFEIVQAVRSMHEFPVVIVSKNVDEIVERVGLLPNTFIIQGDCANEAILKSADVGYARSFLFRERDVFKRSFALGFRDTRS